MDHVTISHIDGPVLIQSVINLNQVSRLWVLAWLRQKNQTGCGKTSRKHQRPGLGSPQLSCRTAHCPAASDIYPGMKDSDDWWDHQLCRHSQRSLVRNSRNRVSSWCFCSKAYVYIQVYPQDCIYTHIYIMCIYPCMQDQHAWISTLYHLCWRIWPNLGKTRMVAAELSC